MPHKHPSDRRRRGRCRLGSSRTTIPSSGKSSEVDDSCADSRESSANDQNDVRADLRSEDNRLRWGQLTDLTGKFIEQYNGIGLSYERIRANLLAANLITVRKIGTDQCIESTGLDFDSWTKSRGGSTNITDFLEKAVERLRVELDKLAPPPVCNNCPANPPESSALEPDRITASVNGISVTLQFKNSGGNDVHDIETYLQEKLDVLEFIQMDCNKMEMTQFPASSTSRMIRAPQLEKTNLSVADWYLSDTNKTIHLPESESFAESVIAPSQRSQLKDLADDGFFIGTPSSRAEEPQILVDESHLEWETSSVLSSYSSRPSKRSQARNRSFSNSSIEDSRSKPSSMGMFGRGRLARLAVNMSGYSDENISIEGSPRHGGSSWWDSGY